MVLIGVVVVLVGGVGRANWKVWTAVVVERWIVAAGDMGGLLGAGLRVA